MKTKIYIVWGLAFILMAGCKKNTPDTEKPSISINVPSPGQSFSVGNSIGIQATVSDNVELKSYDLTISLKSPSGILLKSVPTSVPFTFSKATTSLTGKSANIAESGVLIPTDTPTSYVTPGTYSLKINCTDTSGNTATTVVEFKIN